MRSISIIFMLIGLLGNLPCLTASGKDQDQYILIPYKQAQGLIPSYINQMASDSLGQLQLATYGSGILSFDGKEFASLSDRILTKHPIIRKLWIEKHLYYFVTENELFVWNRQSDIIQSLFKGETPILYFSKLDGEKILVSNYSGNFFVSLKDNNILESQPINTSAAILDYLKLSENQHVYITLDNELVLSENGKNNQILFSEKNDFFKSIVTHPEFLGVFGGEYFYFFDKTTFQLLQKQKLTGIQNIITTLADGDKIWIGSQDGLFLWSQGEFTKVNTSPTLNHIAISNLIRTFDGTIWISTYGNGIYKLYDTHISKYFWEGENIGSINSISKVKGKTDNFLITAANGVFSIKDQMITEIRLPQSSPSRMYYSGVQDSLGNIWIGADGFILRRKKGETDFSLMIHPVFENNLITSIVPYRDKIYVGTRKGLYLFNKHLELIKIFNKDSEIKPHNINHITVIGSDKIIFGNSFNLYETDGNTIKSFEIEGIEGEILSFDQVGNYLYWMGSSAGKAYLYDFRNQTIKKQISIKNGNNIYSIAGLQDSSVVTGSEMGIERHFNDGQILLYDDRIRFSEVNYNSISFSENGNLLIGTTEGLYKIAANYTFKPKSYPILDFITVNRTQVNIKDLIHEKKPLVLAHHENNLSFQFKLINYFFPENIRVRHKLMGFEENWGPFGKPGTITYTRLPPGEYTLFTNIQYGQGDEITYTLPLKIFIRNPFWFHPMMMILMLIFAFGSVYFGYVWFQRKTISRNKKLTKLVEERTHEINEINVNLEKTIQSRTQDLHLKNEELVNTINQKNKFQHYVKLISANTKDIFCMVRDNFEIIIISDSVEDLLGISGRELINRPISILFAEEKSTALMMEYIRQPQDQPLGLILPILHHKTGNEVLIEVLAKKINGSLPDEDLGYVLNLRDVTEREYLKKELKLVYKNIHRDFHDEVGNKLAKIIALVSVMKIQFEGQANSDNLMAKVESTAKHLYRDTRDFVWSLDQENNNLEDLSLQLRDFGENLFDGSPISFNCDLHIRENLSLKPNLVRDILLIVKELMTNVLKHSNAQQVHLIIKQYGKQMIFLVKDDGVGISKKVNQTGNGLKNIHFRISRCKGMLILKSRKGTLLGLRIAAEESI